MTYVVLGGDDTVMNWMWAMSKRNHDFMIGVINALYTQPYAALTRSGYKAQEY